MTANEVRRHTLLDEHAVTRSHMSLRSSGSQLHVHHHHHLIFKAHDNE